MDCFLVAYTSVKLNNPLMGTETGVLLLSDNERQEQKVKLNNPLMGTETPPLSGGERKTEYE